METCIKIKNLIAIMQATPYSFEMVVTYIAVKIFNFEDLDIDTGSNECLLQEVIAFFVA